MMDTAPRPAVVLHGFTLKDVSPQVPTTASPPPAYTPSRIRGMSQSSQALLQEATARMLSRQPLTTMLSGTADEQDDTDSSTSISSISLRINSSVSISNSNNLVCLAETPAEHANAIARAVVLALQESSSGQCGIPMIDEDGRPRPVKIEVDASMTVDGTGNIVGSEGVINEVLQQRSQLRRRREEEQDENICPAIPSKRRRSSR